MLSEPVLVVAELARVFDALGIRYVVGGSVASSLYGIPRATQDVGVRSIPGVSGGGNLWSTRAA